MENSTVRPDFYSLGQIAHRNGESSAPTLNNQVRAAIANEPIGGNAARIMREFSRGWHDANLSKTLDFCSRV